MKQNNTTALITAPIEDVYGFYGTIHMNERLSEKQAIKAWESAFEVFRAAPWKPTDIAIRNFLRSRWGRHFADATSFFKGSLKKRIERASEEKWVAQEFAKLHREGFSSKLFEDDDCSA